MSEDTYHSDQCDAVREAVTILGDKWSAFLIQALSERALRFGELQSAAGGINPRTLSARLKRLQELRVISSDACTASPQRLEYCLTQKGRDILPILDEMAKWSQSYTKTQ